jgi:hypothetical protein
MQILPSFHPQKKKKQNKKNSPSGEEEEGLRALFGFCMINE